MSAFDRTIATTAVFAALSIGWGSSAHAQGVLESREAEMRGAQMSMSFALEGEHGASQQAAIVSALGEREDQLRGCFAAGEEQTWFVRLSIEGRRFVNAHAERDGAHNGVVSRCITGALRGARVPARVGDSLVVRLRIAEALSTGRGGGGTGEGTIGLGNLGTIGGGNGRGSGSSGQRRRVQASVRMGSMDVRGALARGIVRRVIRRHLNEVRFCYERELASNPALAGTARIRFIIAPDGAVQTTAEQSVRGELGGVPACIMGRIRRWRFPANQASGIVIVTLPFVLASS